MNNKYIKPLDAEIYRFFHCAVSEIEAAKPYWRKKQYEQFVALLQKSACCLAKALLSSKNIIVSDKKLLSDLASDIQEISDIDNPVYSNIHSILTYVANTDENEGLQEIYREYQRTLIEARNILARDLNYNSGIRKKLNQTMFTAAGQKKLSAFVMMLLILVMLPAVIHHFVDPIDRYELDGQVFWKSKPGVPFSSKNSKRFPVVSDNKSREYTIILDSPDNIFLFRLDPVNAIGLTDIEIEAIRLLGPGNVLLKKIVFDNSMYWSCTNCIPLESNANTYRMRPTNSDPYLTSSAINQEGVKKIIINMRAVSKKTFWEWVLSIDKNMEF